MPFSLSVLILREGWCLEGETILSICERGDKLLAEEVGKVYKGKKISKGQRTQSHSNGDFADIIFQEYHIPQLSLLALTLPHTLRYLQMPKKRLRHSKPTRRSRFSWELK